MCLVVENSEVFKTIIKNRIGATIYFKCRKWKRFAFELRAGLLEVIAVEVYVAAAPHKILRFEVALLGDHLCQQSIAGDVKRKSEKDVGTALIELAGEFPARDVELKKGVTRRQSHVLQVAGIPRRDDMAAAVGIVFYAFDKFRDLVNRLARSCVPVSPLHGITRPDTARFIRPCVPNFDSVFLQISDVVRAFKKPQKLVDDGAKVKFFSRE